MESRGVRELLGSMKESDIESILEKFDIETLEKIIKVIQRFYYLEPEIELDPEFLLSLDSIEYIDEFILETFEIIKYITTGGISYKTRQEPVNKIIEGFV